MKSQQRVKDLFADALEQPVEQREAFLEAACRGDEALREQVVAMLSAHDQAGEFMSSPTQPDVPFPDTRTARNNKPAEGPGTVIGNYKLLQEIGHGGFGVVYMAEQEKPVRRKVALKIIKLGMDTKQVIARFEAERQALAMMDHPNIARVFDAGATETGRSYFVMELVKGISITEYCDKNNLSTRDRLDLFMPVCHAIQHAHQKGIIHRDIKPSNVMVTLHDGKPVPKVIDFGIAKATDHRLTEKTLFTEYHQLVGTPAYMSPEQAEMSGLDIDTRTDIYSLGVLLYELLTGTTPFEAEMLRQAAYGEIQRIIREVEPHKPSTRVSSLQSETSRQASGSGSDPSEPRAPATGQLRSEPGAQATGLSLGSTTSETVALTPRLRSGLGSAAEIAKHRRTDPSALAKLLRGDLDWIVMKALEKDRTRRYETAKEFANDVEHHLANEPILASPPRAAYKLRKFIMRNRVAVTAGSLVAAALVIGLIVSMIGFVQAGRQRDRAIVAEQEQSRERQRAEAARTAEAEQRKLAESERDQAIEAKHEARRQAYISGIKATSAALAMNEMRTVRKLLDAAPPGFRGWEWRYLDAQADDSLNVLRGHGEPVNSAAFSPNGRVLASGSGWDGRPLDVDYTVRLWDSSTGKQLSALKGHTGAVYQVAFSPDGTRLASASRDTTIRIWDVTTAEELAVWRGHDGEVFSVAFSPDGTRLASGSDDKTVRLWEASTGEELAVLRGHEAFILSVAFSPDGTRLASASGDATVRLWDASTGEELAILGGHKRWVQSVVFSPDGTRLASASSDSTVRLWDASTGDELAVMWGHRWGVASVAFSPDGGHLASASWDNTVRLWDAVTGEELAILRGHEDIVYSVAFSPDGERLVSASKDKSVRIWDALMDERLIITGRHVETVMSVAFSPNGKRLASAGIWRSNEDYDDTVRLWDAATGEELAVLRGHKGHVNSVTFSPDSTRLASASVDKTIRLWDMTTGEELAILRGHEDNVQSVAFSPDGTRLASAALDNTIRLWNATTGEEVAVLRRDDVRFGSVTFSPDGRHLAVASSGNTVRLWEVSSGLELAVMAGHERSVTCVTFSPDCRLVASASWDGTVRLWDTSTGEERTVLRGHESAVVSVDFSPDGSRLASASLDRTVRLWNVLTGDEVAILRGHEGFVNSVVFSQDGERLASASSDQSVRMWDTRPYRVRYQERQAIVAARPEAERIVDALWLESNDWKTVAVRLREDVTLSDPLRRAALNLVLRRATEHP